MTNLNLETRYRINCKSYHESQDRNCHRKSSLFNCRSLLL